MRIGAYELSSQLNIYSKFNSASIRQAEASEIKPEAVKAPKEEASVALSLNGKEYMLGASYSKYSSSPVVLNSQVQKLDDFSLVSAKEDKIVSRVKNAEEPNYKEIISDEKMDGFLKKAFRLYDSE
ncbi:MAG: hypothetical protein J5515_07165 [Lachnospiraceae bacterium]|nr:hypothetical protein [Lachnospiraceae bacterium]